jgi:Clp amino terminal domain.
MRLQISKELNEIITYSKEEAMRLGSYEITSDHLMLGIIRHEDNIASKILNRIGLDSNLLKKEIEEHIRKKV